MAKSFPGVANNLDSFAQFSRPQFCALYTSQEIRDRGSIFVANIYRATTPEEAQAGINHLKHVVHGPKPASHDIAAWRCMALKHGRTGLGGLDDFELRTASIDDGENWAGAKVLGVMQNQAVIDAVVIVSRWYGGTLLGPARFSHIETCALEVCRAFKRKEELDECISMLGTLDDILTEVRAELTKSSPNPSTETPLGKASKKPDYSQLDVAKAKRLINARENAIKGVKSVLAERRPGL